MITKMESYCNRIMFILILHKMKFNIIELNYDSIANDIKVIISESPLLPVYF